MSSDDPNVSDKIDILSTDDTKLKAIGEILSSDSSRQILKLLFNNSLSANQISQETEMSLPLVIHHLKKMQTAGIIKITNIGKNTKSHDVKFYTIDKVAIVILPSEMKKPAKKSKSLFNSFNRIHRLATLGGVSIAAWFSSQIFQKSSDNQSLDLDESIYSEEPMMAEEEMAIRSAVPEELEKTSQDVASTSIQTTEPSFDFALSLIPVLLVIITGLVIEVIISGRRKKSVSY